MTSLTHFSRTLKMLAAPVFMFQVSVFAAPNKLCQELLTRYGRVNAKQLPAELQFHSWSPPIAPLQTQESLGTLEFYWAKPGAIAIETFSGMTEKHFLRRKNLGRILALTTFAGFVNEEEFHEFLAGQPIPDSAKAALDKRGLVHLLKRMPENYFMLTADTPPEQLKRRLSIPALHKLKQILADFEAQLAGQGLMIDSAQFAVSADGSALLVNFESVRERSVGDVEIFLWREKNSVETALVI